MNPQIEDGKSLAEAVRSKLRERNDAQRVEFLAELARGYCRACGSDVSERDCYCMRDE